MTIRAFLLVILLVLSACSDNPEPEPTAIAVQAPAVENLSPAQETGRLNTWLDEQYETQLDFSPMARTRLGNKKDYDKLNDLSVAGEDEQLQWLRDSVATMEAEFDYSRLSQSGQLSYDMWKYSLERMENAVPWRYHNYIFGRGGAHAYLPTFMINFHRVDNVVDFEAYLSRLQQFDEVLDQLLERDRETASRGIRQPLFAYEFAIGEIGRIMSGVPFTVDDSMPNSPLWTDLQSKLQALLEGEQVSLEQAEAYREQAREILSGEVMAAYDELLAWLEAEKLYADAEPKGVWALPDGDAYYQHRLLQMTTLELTAEEIHNIGLAEVDRLLVEMQAIMESVGFEGSLQDFFVFLREDEQFYYPNTDEGRQDYLDINNEYLDYINERLPEFFGRLPKAPLVVRRVEAFREQDGAAQHYNRGTPDGSRPGVFYSHMSDMSTLAKWQIEDIAYHEGNPGHHMQLSIQQELTDVPKFRTQYGSTAYIEGWGLYAEWLAKEMGAYQDPYSDFGRLSGEIWRAARLVVDTGIHALQWSEEQAVDYFLQNTPLPEGAVRSEVERYITNPGQATAYKIGMLNFQQARANAEVALGEAFDIREFHDVVLEAGAVPMPFMHTRVEQWVEGNRPE